MFERLLIRLEALFFPLVHSMETAIASSGVDWQKYSDNEKKTVAVAASLAKVIKTVLDTPILSEEGNLTEESAQIADEVKKIVDQQANT